MKKTKKTNNDIRSGAASPPPAPTGKERAMGREKEFETTGRLLSRDTAESVDAVGAP